MLAVKIYAVIIFFPNAFHVFLYLNDLLTTQLNNDPLFWLARCPVTTFTHDLKGEAMETQAHDIFLIMTNFIFLLNFANLFYLFHFNFFYFIKQFYHFIGWDKPLFSSCHLT